MSQVLYEGKSKLVCQGPREGSLLIRYKDTATAFNGEKKAELAGKGVLNAAISNRIFQYLMDHGVETHLIQVVDDVSAVSYTHLDVYKRQYQGRQRVHGGLQIGKPPALRLLYPFVGIVVAVEDDTLMGGNGLPDEVAQGSLEIVGVFQDIGKLTQAFGHHRIQHDIGTGDGKSAAQHAKLKLIAGEGKGRGAVPVSYTHLDVYKRQV